ncbi:MAG: hypothetical protein WAM70_07490, partial [Pyrinomonadaceae bacterium]
LICFWFFHAVSLIVFSFVRKGAKLIEVTNASASGWNSTPNCYWQMRGSEKTTALWARLV